mmetsp:Transcript_17257/g.36031  ORF Transcript_17257/g.36031 Transcript_17257/m.36031 type:complete len:239 (-) Transcript_17257:544-1260(-)
MTRLWQTIVEDHIIRQAQPTKGSQVDIVVQAHQLAHDHPIGALGSIHRQQGFLGSLGGLGGVAVHEDLVIGRRKGTFSIRDGRAHGHLIFSSSLSCIERGETFQGLLAAPSLQKHGPGLGRILHLCKPLLRKLPTCAADAADILRHGRNVTAVVGAIFKETMQEESGPLSEVVLGFAKKLILLHGQSFSFFLLELFLNGSIARDETSQGIPDQHEGVLPLTRLTLGYQVLTALDLGIF